MYYVLIVADREGFEPSLRFPVNTLSKRAPSAARPPVRPQGTRDYIPSHLPGKLSLSCISSHKFFGYALVARTWVLLCSRAIKYRLRE